MRYLFAHLVFITRSCVHFALLFCLVVRPFHGLKVVLKHYEQILSCFNRDACVAKEKA